MIMKKNYFKPEVVVVNVVIDNIMQMTSTPVGGDADSGFPKESKGSRGEWGNVWAN